MRSTSCKSIYPIGEDDSATILGQGEGGTRRRGMETTAAYASSLEFTK